MFPVSVLKMTTSPLYHQMETLEFHFKIVWVILGLPGQNLGWPRSWGCSCEPGHPLPGLCFLEASLLRYGDCGWQTLVFKLGFPGSSAGKESTCNAGDPRFNSWVRKIPLRRDRLPTLVFLGFPVAQIVKNWSAVWETRVPLLGWEDPLEEGMANCSSIVAWRIPMDRGAWRAIVHGVAKSWTPLSSRLSVAQHSFQVSLFWEPKHLLSEWVSCSFWLLSAICDFWTSYWKLAVGKGWMGKAKDSFSRLMSMDRCDEWGQFSGSRKYEIFSLNQDFLPRFQED